MIVNASTEVHAYISNALELLGFVNTDAFDNLVELASVIRKETIWFHVDGGLVILDPERRNLVQGIEQADSLAIELSRSFRALKVWFTLKEHGIIKLGQKITDNCQQAQYLASLLRKHKEFIRILCPVILNIVNIRLEPEVEGLDKLNDELIDLFNNELLADIQMFGIAAASTTRVRGQLYIHICIVGHRSNLEDFDIFVDTLIRIYHVRLLNLKQSINLVNQI
ncbi:unnamed protein product [Rotaria magnacalcarata]|uniref:Uncharacterized protein n=1 Tax=Rotaria magnacalcarata TaxID=392030 RepID=A0A819V904_9BILA|nr:unnamed protein product [Rotaria magnacalcarata]